MTGAFEMEGMKEIKEWEIIPGEFPASKTAVEMGMGGGRLSVGIEYYTNIKRETLTADKFVPPVKDEGFTQGTLMDLMPGREKLEVVPVQPLCRRRVTNLRLAFNSSEMFGPRIQKPRAFFLSRLRHKGTFPGKNCFTLVVVNAVS